MKIQEEITKMSFWLVFCEEWKFNNFKLYEFTRKTICILLGLKKVSMLESNTNSPTF